MSKEICISSTPHETRLAIIEDEQLTEVYYERENEYTLAGSIYKGRVTRVLPGMQSAFVDVGLERDAFLYVTDFLEEQEDSAEFERLPGNGGQERSREQPGRVQPAKGSSSSREPREARAAYSDGASSVQEDSASAPSEEFESGTRRWRGRRGRRNRGGLRPTVARPAQQDELRAEAAPEPAAASRQEPLSPPPDAPSYLPSYLPGESLSKYGAQASGAPQPKENSRPAEASPVQQRTTFIPAKPSTLIETPLQWSGAGLLAGESISRYREGVTNPPAAVSGQSEPADTREEAFHEEEAESATLPWQPSELSPPEVPFPSTSLSEEEPRAAEAPLDFEPEEASAVYRVAPSAPSEFRVAAPPPAGVEAEPLEEAEPFPAIAEIERHFRQEQEEEREEEREEKSAARSESEQAAGVAAAEREDDSEQDFDDSGHELYGAAASGLLEEEEVAEEEEYDFTPLYSHSEDHDLEDMEEETLEQQAMAGAEIDDLVRDTHIEQRVGAEASGLTIDEEESGDEFAELEPEAEESPAVSAAGQPARRDRHDHRRDGRGGRHDNRRRHNGRRQTAQMSELPIISELLKQGQEILVQIAKEPIAKKGARITSHIALPGRFLVFMPTVNHVGVSRKISSDEERQRLKRILNSEKGTGGGGFIVRTAADGASEDDLRADIRFLISLWTEIKQRADAAKAPALIYHDLNLVERILRDQVSDNFSTIWVDNEVEYERTVRFLNRFQPSLVRRVRLYTKETPLFEQFGIQEEISKALKSKVWLKSGGSIVINQTEALVAIDINTGKYVGKTARLEDTILKTNLDAIPEIVRQIRLRDLGGIIVIDFIDMDERKNRHKVMQALEEALKSDRAPSKVLQFNDFGLVAITRKRVKQSLERTLCVQCTICAGTGMTKSPTTVCNEIYVEMRKMQLNLERQDVLLRVHPEVVKTLKANNARWITELEEMSGKTVIVKSDPALHPEQFDIH